MQTAQISSRSLKERRINEDDDNNDPKMHMLSFSSERVNNLLSPTIFEFPPRFDGWEDRIYAGDFIRYTPIDVAAHIFSFVEADKAYFGRLKLVSKAWNAFLSTRWSQLTTKSTMSGLVALRFKSINTTVFFKLTRSGTAKRNIIGELIHGRLIDSNNGLLLFLKRFKKGSVVVHSSTGVEDHVPCALTPSGATRLIPESHNHYKLAAFSLSSNAGVLSLKIFSSDTKEMEAVEVAVPDSVAMSRDEKVTSFFTSKGVLYYTTFDWLFVYDLKDGCSTFLRLPVSGCVVPRSPRLVWRSEGRLYYAFGHSDPQPGFQLWELNESEWQMVCSHFLADVRNEYPRVFEGDLDSYGDPSVCKPCAFNDDFGILYLELQGMLLSYHLETRMFTKACAFIRRTSQWGARMIFPFYFGSDKDSCKIGEDSFKIGKRGSSTIFISLYGSH